MSLKNTLSNGQTGAKKNIRNIKRNLNWYFIGYDLKENSIPWTSIVYLNKTGNDELLSVWKELLIEWSNKFPEYINKTYIDEETGEEVYLNREKRFSEFVEKDWDEWLSKIENVIEPKLYVEPTKQSVGYRTITKKSRGTFATTRVGGSLIKYKPQGGKKKRTHKKKPKNK